jgi:hypothetical protein
MMSDATNATKMTAGLTLIAPQHHQHKNSKSTNGVSSTPPPTCSKSLYLTIDRSCLHFSYEEKIRLLFACNEFWRKLWYTSEEEYSALCEALTKFDWVTYFGINFKNMDTAFWNENTDFMKVHQNSLHWCLVSLLPPTVSNSRPLRTIIGLKYETLPGFWFHEQHRYYNFTQCRLVEVTVPASAYAPSDTCALLFEQTKTKMEELLHEGAIIPSNKSLNILRRFFDTEAQFPVEIQIILFEYMPRVQVTRYTHLVASRTRLQSEQKLLASRKRKVATS